MGLKVRSNKSSSKEIVESGYDRISGEYTAWAKTVRRDERERYTRFLLENVPAGGSILDLGCGAGDPTTIKLAERFTVTGVDISSRQIEKARINVPRAVFVQGDMIALRFPSASFDAVSAFYSITHVPREQHRTLLSMIAGWLRPGGLFVASFSVGSSSGAVQADFLGAPMFFSGYSARTNKRLVKAAGLEILSAEQESAEEFGRPITFLWIIARKPVQTFNV